MPARRHSRRYPDKPGSISQIAKWNCLCRGAFRRPTAFRLNASKKYNLTVPHPPLLRVGRTSQRHRISALALVLLFIQGTMMRDSSRLNSCAPGNWLRKYSINRRAPGRPFVCINPMRYKNTSN